MTFMALGVCGLLVLVSGAYHRPDPPSEVSKPVGPSHALPVWMFVLAPVLAFLVVFLMILVAPIG
jgi:hypothetical protein